MQREETLKLRAKLEVAEMSRLAGAPTYTLNESRRRLEKIYRCANQQYQNPSSRNQKNCTWI